MLSVIYVFVCSQPRLARSVGEALCWVGSTGLLSGFLASTINRILEVSSSLGGGSAPSTYSQLFSVPPHLVGPGIVPVGAVLLGAYRCRIPST